MSTHYDDQVGYSTAAVEAFLPAVWDDEFVLSARPPKAAANGLRAKVDPRHVPDYLLAAADVQLGFRRAPLSHEERECLRHVHHLGFTPGALGAAWSVAPEQVHAVCMSGVNKIAQYLSGRSPK